MAALHFSLSSIFLLTTQTSLCDTIVVRSTRLLQKLYMYPGTLNNFVYSQWSIYRHTVKFEIYFLILDLTLSKVEVTNKIRMILLFLSDYYSFFL